MDLLPQTVLTTENNGNHQITQKQQKRRTRKQHAKNTMPKSLILHSTYYWPPKEANSRWSGKSIRKKTRCWNFQWFTVQGLSKLEILHLIYLGRLSFYWENIQIFKLIVSFTTHNILTRNYTIRLYRINPQTWAWNDLNVPGNQKEC